MSTIAEQLIGSVAQTSTQTPDLAKAISSGADLAVQAENVQAMRQKMEEAKVTHEMNKMNTIVDTLELAAKATDPKIKSFLLKNVVPSKVKALGLDKTFSSDSLGLMQASDEALRKVVGLRLKYIGMAQDGTMKGHEAYKAFLSEVNDPELIASSDADKFMEAQKFAASEEGKGSRAKQVQAGQQGRFDITQYQKVKDDFDAATKPLSEAMTAGDNALSLLNTEGPIAAEAVKTQLARLAGEKGPLTDQDVARFGGARDLLSRADSLFTKLTTGNITPETREEYKTIISEMQNVVRAKITAQEERSMGSAEALGLDPERTRKVLSANQIKGGMEWKAAVKKGKAKLLALTPAQREIMAKKFGITLAELEKELGE